VEVIANPRKQGNKKKTNQDQIHKANFRRVRKICSGLDTIGEYAHRAMRSSRGIERQGLGNRKQGTGLRDRWLKHSNSADQKRE
jgi:hypothetical protein